LNFPPSEKESGVTLTIPITLQLAMSSFFLAAKYTIIAARALRALPQERRDASDLLVHFIARSPI
jgi:hypothetical protein